MSAAHRTARPKGYMTWKPSPDVLTVVGQTLEILDEYSGYGPMTVRQIFYRLVGNYDYDKTERAYKRLAEYLVKARRSQMVSFHAIRDDGGTTAGGGYGFNSVDEFLDSVAGYGEAYRLPPALGQPYSIEVWCEAEGMVPMLSQMVQPFGVQVTGTGGFSSLTVTHSFAARVARRSTPTVLLHVGDFDPSGVSIFESMCQDIGAFVAGRTGGIHDTHTGAVPGRFLPHRVALTEEQVAQHDLPTAPPKASDSRSVNWNGSTTQAEALPPDLLAEIVTSAVQDWWSTDAEERKNDREAAERAVIGAQLSDAVEDLREPIRKALNNL